MLRILQKNIKGESFRICSFSFETDRHNEEYIKFSFPDLKGTPFFYNNIETMNPEEELIMEYSIHIQSDISHFKSSNQKRFYRKESDMSSKFKELKIIHLFSYSIYDLNHFKVFNRKFNDDYVLRDIFNPEKGKMLDFYLTKIDDDVIIPDIKYKDLERKMFHSFRNKKYRLLMIEYDFINLNKGKTGVAIFRKHDPKIEYITIPSTPPSHSHNQSG